MRFGQGSETLLLDELVRCRTLFENIVAYILAFALIAGILGLRFGRGSADQVVILGGAKRQQALYRSSAVNISQTVQAGPG